MQQTGVAIIELNHSGISDVDLSPEAFSVQQMGLLNSLPSEYQEPIRKGYPFLIIDIGTGKKLGVFNLKNIVLTRHQTEAFAQLLLEKVRQYKLAMEKTQTNDVEDK